MPFATAFRNTTTAAIVTLAMLAPAAAQARNYDKVHVRNKCDREIQAAIRYKDLSGNWKTVGWFHLDPGERAYVADTRNRYVYFYAESIGPVSSRLHWEGDDSYHNIRYSDFEYGFFEGYITTDSWGSWTQSFTCD